MGIGNRCASTEWRNVVLSEAASRQSPEEVTRASPPPQEILVSGTFPSQCHLFFPKRRYSRVFHCLRRIRHPVRICPGRRGSFRLSSSSDVRTSICQLYSNSYAIERANPSRPG